MMWVFGYGSLMWDGWEKQFQCEESQVSQLDGHVRAFNKASVKNWGTNAHPGPTLNLRPQLKSTCTGIAFGFAEDRLEEVMSYLRRREGGFDFDQVNITFNGGHLVQAVVPVYRGKNILPDMAADELAAMAAKADGTDGRAVDYILNVDRHLRAIGINDAVVTALAQAVRQPTATRL